MSQGGDRPAFLGGFIGDNESTVEYVKQKVQMWV